MQGWCIGCSAGSTPLHPHPSPHPTPAAWFGVWGRDNVIGGVGDISRGRLGKFVPVPVFFNFFSCQAGHLAFRASFD
jgi:hypothetical protein